MTILEFIVILIIAVCFVCFIASVCMFLFNKHGKFLSLICMIMSLLAIYLGTRTGVVKIVQDPLTDLVLQESKIRSLDGIITVQFATPKGFKVEPVFYEEIGSSTVYLVPDGHKAYWTTGPKMGKKE